MLAGDELRQIARLLLVIAVAHDLVDAEVRMRAVRQPDRAGGARHFLHRHAMLEIAQAEPPIFLRRGDPVQAELPHLGPEVARKRVVAVDLRRARGDLLFGEAAGAVADHRGALAEIEVEGTGRVRDHGRGVRRGSEDTTLCAIGDAVQPFAAALAWAFWPAVISGPESRPSEDARHFRSKRRPLLFAVRGNGGAVLRPGKSVESAWTAHESQRSRW